tara:strand:+ start:124 stop:510 length:387 start_codon:yes stop_codon:yes gene_type:complete
MTTKNTSIERDTLLRQSLKRESELARDVKRKDNTMKDTRNAIEAKEYNELLELFTLKYGDDGERELEKKYRIKGVKGGIYTIFKREMPNHAFTRAIDEVGSNMVQFRDSETGIEYVLRINGAKVVDKK